MLKKQDRLVSQKDFKEAFGKGKGVKNAFLYFKTAPNQKGRIRFGFVVNKKISGKAAVRNRIKRILRETVRQELAKNAYQELGYDVVIVVLPEIAKILPSPVIARKIESQKIREEVILNLKLLEKNVFNKPV